MLSSHLVLGIALRSSNRSMKAPPIRDGVADAVPQRQKRDLD